MRLTIWVRVGLVAIGVLLAAGAALFVAAYPPTDNSFYPKCQLHQLTGLHCMGCGMTRSTHSLLNGQVAQAFAYNPFAPVAVVWLITESARRVWPQMRGRSDPGWYFRADWTPWLMLVLSAFMVLRNLPWWPFHLLAPHKLS